MPADAAPACILPNTPAGPIILSAWTATDAGYANGSYRRSNMKPDQPIYICSTN